MPSVKNPNKPSRNRLAAKAAKFRKQRQKQSAAGKTLDITKSNAPRGARPGILPTSGPRAPISSKKKRKLERNLGYALKRKMEADGEVEMKDSQTVDGSKKSAQNDKGADQMELNTS